MNSRSFKKPCFINALRWLLASFFFAAVSVSTVVSQAQAAGPWRGQIVDKETGKPLDGVVIVALWRQCELIVMDGCADYYGSEEVVTGSDGRFLIEPRRILGMLPPLRMLKGPDLYIFKSSYGQWRLKSLGSAAVQDEDAWRQNGSNEQVIIELPPLKTRKERLDFYDTPGRTPPGMVPPEKMIHWQKEEQKERSYLGFRS